MVNPGAGLGFESHALRFAEGYFPVFGPLPFEKRTSGAEAQILVGPYGPTKVVP